MALCCDVPQDREHGGYPFVDDRDHGGLGDQLATIDPMVRVLDAPRAGLAVED